LAAPKEVGAFVGRGGYPDESQAFVLDSVVSSLFLAATLAASREKHESAVVLIDAALFRNADEPEKQTPADAAPPPNVNPPTPIDASVDDSAGAAGAEAPPKVNPPAPVDARPEVTESCPDAGATGAAPPKVNPLAPMDASEGTDASNAGPVGAAWPGVLTLPPPKGIGAFVDRGGYPDDSLGFTIVFASSFV
jgi:hypothetical protein